MDLDDLIAAAQPRTEEVRVCVRGDLVSKHIKLVEELNGALSKDKSLGANSEAQRISAEIVALENEQEEHSLTFRISEVSARKWANLLAKYPPTPKQRREQNADHDPDKFPPAALAACCVEPEVSPLQAERLFDTLHAGDWNKLWFAVIGLNVTGTPSPKLAAATELLQANGQSSTTQPPEASPEESSLAGSGERSPDTTTTSKGDSTTP